MPGSDVTERGPRFLTVQQVAERYQVAVATVYDWVFHKRIPHHKPSRNTLRFNETELDIWDQRNAVPAKYPKRRGA